jgi:hypothetical protein
VPSLHDIEKTVSTLWMNQEARQWLLNGKKGPMPAVLTGAPAEVLNTVDRNGVRLYGGLMNYGHQDVMLSIYPYCSKLIGENWESLVDDYLVKFPPDHYNFNRLCYRLSEYFTRYGGKYLKRYPFIAELADYEWIELEKMELDVDIHPRPHEPLASPEHIAALAPLVNPTLTVRKYKYNIPDIANALEDDEKLPAKIDPEETYVAIFRHPENHRCKFVEVGAAAARVLEMTHGQTLSYQSLIPVVVSLTPDVNPQESVMEFLELIEELQEMRVLVGSVQAG